MNNPQINPDDPKWTAYVLGELDEAERAEIERLIETSGEARALIDELNLATVMLKEELTPLSALAMTPEQKAAIRVAAEPAPSRFALFPMKWGWAAAGVAAAVVLAVTPLLVPTSKEVQIAQNIPAPAAIQEVRQQQSTGKEANESRQQAETYAEKTELKKQDQSREPESQLRAHRKHVQIVFQDPYRSLNPRRTVGASIIEGPVNFGMGEADATKRARELMRLVGLSPDALSRSTIQPWWGPRRARFAPRKKRQPPRLR